MGIREIFPNEKKIVFLGVSSTSILPKGGTVVADACAISGSHKNVICLSADQVIHGAVGAGAAAGKCLSCTSCCHGIGQCICTGGPTHLGSIGSTY